MQLIYAIPPLLEQTLTCKVCNNTAGSHLDKHLKNYIDTEDFLRGISDIPVRATIGFAGLKAAVDWHHRKGDKPEMELHIKEKATKKGHPEAIKEEFLKRGSDLDGFSFQLNWKLTFSQWRAHVALLRLAYLRVFTKFGYPFALGKFAKPVLTQIKRPAEHLLPDCFCMDFPNPPFEGNNIFLVKEPKEYRSILVILKLKAAKRKVHKGIILPHPWDSEASIYEKLEEHKKGADAFTGTFHRITAKKIDLTDPDNLMAVFWIWEGI